MSKRLLALVLAAAASAFAQDTPPTPHQAPKPAPVAYGRVTGTVFCADTRRPARGADILFFPVPANDPDPNNPTRSTPKIARTSLDGVYTVAAVPAGEYAILAFYPGYISPLKEGEISNFSADSKDQREAFRRIGTIVVTANATLTSDITLERGAVLSGRALFSDGTPVTEANIDVEDINAKPKPTAPPPMFEEPDLSTVLNKTFSHQTYSTDDEGRFRITGLRPGSYRIAAVQSTSVAATGDADGDQAVMMGIFGINSDKSALRVYAGNTLHRKAAKQFDLRSGDTVANIDITIPLDAFHKVRGTFQAIDGRPLSTASLTLTDTTDDTFTYQTKLSRDGTFEFSNVPSGTYKLSATSGTISQPAPDGPSEGHIELTDGTQIVPTNLFADTDTTFIVKDSDLADVALTSKEIPFPKGDVSPTPPAPPAGSNQ